MIKILPAHNSSAIESISTLAHTIWHEHYITIISVEQIEYMLKKFNSPESIKTQIEAGSNFYVIMFSDVPVGYIAIKLENDHLFLSKLYVLSNYRGKKIGRTAIDYISEIARKKGLKSIKLNVNKSNTKSIMAYTKFGFVKEKSMVTDIGNGYIMDDYQMVKSL